MSRAGTIARQARRVARLVCLLAHLFLGTLAAFTLLALWQARRDIRRAQALVRWWHRRLLRILNVRVVAEGAVHDSPVLMVANHVSWLDIPCIASVADTLFVAKEDVARWPLIGALARRAGTIFLARGRTDASAHAAERMAWALLEGRRLLLFPEATTTDGREVRAFHARLFQAAIRTRCPVQAIALSYPHARGTHPAAPFIGDNDLVRHLWALLGEDSLTARLHFCTPVNAAGRERRALADDTRARIRHALGFAHTPANALHRNVIPRSPAVPRLRPG